MEGADDSIDVDLSKGEELLWLIMPIQINVMISISLNGAEILLWEKLAFWNICVSNYKIGKLQR